MDTVAETLREDSRERLRRMAPAERLAEALRLEQAAITAYAAAHGLDRRPSRVLGDLVGCASWPRCS